MWPGDNNRRSCDSKSGKAFNRDGTPMAAKQSAAQAHAEARAAIAKGASKSDINKRLAAAGYPTL